MEELLDRPYFDADVSACVGADDGGVLDGIM